MRYVSGIVAAAAALSVLLPGSAWNSQIHQNLRDLAGGLTVSRAAAEAAACSSRYATRIRRGSFSCRVAQAAVERWVGRPRGCGRGCSLGGVVNGPNNGMVCDEDVSALVRCDVDIRGQSGSISFSVETRDVTRLLAEFVPMLKFDSDSNYLNGAVEQITRWHENQLRIDTGDPAAPCAEFDRYAHGAETGRDWSPETLVTNPIPYPGTSCQSGRDDHIDANGDDFRASASYRDSEFDNVVYGRAVHDETSNLWLQYWFFYYYNEGRSVAHVGRHQGDWEMVQFGFRGDDDVPDVATYAQHTHQERCGWPVVENHARVPIGPQAPPVVYVAEYSHASYFRPGTYETEVRQFHESADGNGPSRRPALISITHAPPWSTWPGRWGQDNSGHNVSPSGPAGHSQWNDPRAFNDHGRACRVALRERPAPVAPPSPIRQRRCGPVALPGRPAIASVVAKTTPCDDARAVAEAWVVKAHPEQPADHVIASPCAPADQALEPKRCRVRGYVCITPHTDDGASLSTRCTFGTKTVRFDSGV